MNRLFFAFLFPLFFLGLSALSHAQIAYQRATYKNFYIGTYGRIGADWSFVNEGSIGRRLNLNNMGSIGGRLEEQDYLELATGIDFSPLVKGDSMNVTVNTRFAVWSNSLSLFGNSTTSSAGGLTLAIPELYVEVTGVGKKDLINLWVGSRFYRGPDVHVADHFYFNDHSGQGFGIERKGTRFAALFVASTDTSSTVPPYFYLNIKSGTPELALRQRSVLVLEQDKSLSENTKLTFLAEYHRMGNPDNTDTLPDLAYPGDNGYVLGVRINRKLPKLLSGSFNDFTLRYGRGIANGGDGGVSRTWLTFGAPDLVDQSFRNAYSWSLVEHFLLNISQRFSFNGYIIYNQSKGAAASDHRAETFFGKEVFNRKEDFTLGGRGTWYISDNFHLLSELHYSQRKDGEQPVYAMGKFSLAPTLSTSGERSVWARPHLRFVFSLARYNTYASEQLYSPYLQFVGPERWGYYLGVKAEWWIF
ncbi:MAG: carbohydrate porin [Cyclobacteriaceae bacterium]|nr:carbohydrate porin [Cyclobacteriaceae bacterium]MDX5467511.1 carbohydrate porin [Cyclobacteriaceae bacterium]